MSDVQEMIKALSRGDVTQTKPLLDAIAELQLKLDEQIACSESLDCKLKTALNKSTDSVELNILNYNCDDVERLNQDMIELHEILQTQLQSPAQSLKQLKADAVREFSTELGVYDDEYDDQGYVEVPRYACKEYVNQILKGE